MSVVYLSGPISLGGSCTNAEIAAFETRFAAAAEALRSRGYDVINPCDCEPQDSWAGCMRIHIPSVCRADYVAVLPRWQESRGASLEAFVATQLGVPVLSVDDLLKAAAA